MSEFEARMSALRERFRRRSAEDAGRIRAALADRDWSAVHRASHGLSGSAGIFGYPEISLAAEAVEIAVERELPDEIRQQSCRSLLQMLDALSD